MPPARQNPSAHTSTFTRRNLLRVGGLGMLGLTMPRWARALESDLKKPIAKAKSVIFLFQWGGPSHLETFDLKPDAPEGIRGFHKPIKSSADGIWVSDRLPKTAKIMDKVTIIRSMTHTMKNHNSAGYYALSGHAPPSDDQRLKDTPDLFPAYASVVDRLSPSSDGEIPTSVTHPCLISDGSLTPGQQASFLGKVHDPFLVLRDPNDASFALPELSLPSGISIERMSARRELMKMVDTQSRLLDISAEARGLDAYYEKALNMLHSDRVRKAFDLGQEPQVVREAYGRTTYGQSCLLARRLIEAGVKFVTVNFAPSIGGQSTTEGGWDTHGFNNTRMFPIIDKFHMPITEQTLPTLLNDMEQRGLLKDTLVVWVGEFGRTPKINSNISRDHWPQCYSALLAGGGVKRGYVHGASDRHGEHPAEKPVKPDDLAATMFHLLGIPHDTEVRDFVGRPVPISYGKPVSEIIA